MREKLRRGFFDLVKSVHMRLRDPRSSFSARWFVKTRTEHPWGGVQGWFVSAVMNYERHILLSAHELQVLFPEVEVRSRRALVPRSLIAHRRAEIERDPGAIQRRRHSRELPKSETALKGA